MTEQQVESRWKRRSKHQAQREVTEDIHLPFVSPLLWSFFLAFFSVANPFFTQLATNLQEQILYAGWALQQGQLVYKDVYGTAGILFYGLIWLGSSYQGTVLLILFQFLSAYFSGRKAFALANRLTGKKEVAEAATHFFYFLILILGFGGLYAALFTLPFLILALDLLVPVSAGETGNKGFLRYGALAAVVVLIDPFTGTLFFGVNGLYLFYRNLRAKQLGLGLSQLLAALIGFSLLFYPLDYVTVWNGTFGQALNQGSYVWQTFQFTGADQLQTAFFYGLFLVGVGLPLGLLALGQFSRTQESLFYLPLGIFGTLAIWLVASSQGEFGFHQLLPGLIYFWLLQIFSFDRIQSGLQPGRHQKKRRMSSLFQGYLASLFYLPLLLGAVLVLLPLGQKWLGERSLETERQDVLAYLQQEADRSDTIYAWDSRANWYQEAGKWSASALLSPVYYQQLAENQLRLANDLESVRPRYIVVNTNLALLEDVDKELTTTYTEVKTDLQTLKLYERK